MTGSRGLVNDDGSAFGNRCNFASTPHARGAVRVLTWRLSGLNANLNDGRTRSKELIA